MAEEDSFIREVDDELREDRLKQFWSRFGKIIILSAILVVVATAALRAWQYRAQTRAAGFGDQLTRAIELSAQGKHDEAAGILEKLADEASNDYPVLIKLRLGAEQIAKGDKPAALKNFDQLANNATLETRYRNIAGLRAGILAVDLESYDAVKQRLEPLAAPGQLLRHSAREMLGIAAMKSGNEKEALERFEAIINDAEAAPGVKARAQAMLSLLAGKGVKSSANAVSAN